MLTECPRCHSSSITAKRCTHCGAKVVLVELDARKAEAETENDKALYRIIERLGTTLPRTTTRWRPTQPVWGEHPVWPGRALECVITDGLLAIFVDKEGGTLVGHVEYFQWSEERMLKIPVVDEETGEERTVSVCQKSGAPPPLFSAPRPVSSTGPKATRSVAGKHQTSVRKSALDKAKAVLGL